jgi:hypothetical protein
MIIAQVPSNLMAVSICTAAGPSNSAGTTVPRPVRNTHDF